MKYLGKIQDNKDLVTKEYVDNKTSPEIFWATYNSTTLSQIVQAYNAGKYIACISGTNIFTLKSCRSTSAVFTLVDTKSNYQITTYTVTSSGWSVNNDMPVLSINHISPTYASEGNIQINTDSANATNSTSKLFLIGATSQVASPTTYSNSNVYETNGALNAKSFSVDASANIVYNSSAKSIDFTFV